MNGEKSIKEAKTVMNMGLGVGMFLFGTGVLFILLDIDYISNKKALIGVSFLPLSVALASFLKIIWIKRWPQKMKNIIISENDERLVALKNEADAKAFKVLQGTIFMAYMGYTFMVPADVFETIGWWILLTLFMITFIAQGVLTKAIYKSHDTGDRDE